MKQHTRRGRRLRTFFSIPLLLALATTAIPALAQGCTQCKDNAAATPPATQRAYRHAILLLTFTAAGIFAASVTLLRKNH